MNKVIEIDTLPGVVRCTNDALARAAAELIAAESRASESDLVEVVSLDLDEVSTGESFADFARTFAHPAA